MTAGLQVFNDAGTVQIDENYKNLVCVYSVSYATAGEHTLSLSGRTAPVLVLYSSDPSGIVVMGSSSPSAGSFTWRISGIGEAYVFDVAPPPGAHGQGLQVFAANGELIFDSSYPQLVVAGQLQQRPHFDRLWYPTQTLSSLHALTYSNVGQSDVSTVEPRAAQGDTLTPYSVPNGKKYGWIVGGQRMTWFFNDNYYNDFGHPDAYDYTCYKSLPAIFASGSNLKFAMRNMGTKQSGEYSGPYSQSDPVWLTLVDLTGFGTSSSGGGDTTPPIINTASNFTCVENQTTSITLTANESVTWSLVGGADMSQFEVVSGNLRWKNNGTKDFEAPTDSNGDNAYVVTVRATDGAGNYTDKSITMTVTNSTADDGGGGGGTATFSPVAGTYNVDDGGSGSCQFTITASQSVAWTWSGSNGGSANVTSGSSATSIKFTCFGGINGRYTTITCQANGQTWTINMSATGSGGGVAGGGVSIKL